MRLANGPRSAMHADETATRTGRSERVCIDAQGRYPDVRRGVPESPGYIAGMTTVTITPKGNGPLIIEGPVRIVTPDGRELTPPPRKDGRPAEVVVLCRCGASATKPFCDGSHKRTGFMDAPVTPG